MAGSKHFERLAWTVTALMLVVTLLFMNGGALGLEALSRMMGYEARLFDSTRVHTVDIVMDDWDAFVANAANEEYAAAALVIDGEAYRNVGIRGKGNTSLSTVAAMDSDRYSFKVEFDHYDSAISYHGLDKLSLNNLIQDSTMMKDYLCYTMLRAFGVAAPLCSFVYITVNGEDWGLYLAVEGVEDSFLTRNYGTDHGLLYKPDSVDFGDRADAFAEGGNAARPAAPAEGGNAPQAAPAAPAEGGNAARPAAPAEGGNAARPAAPAEGGNAARPAAPAEGGNAPQAAPAEPATAENGAQEETITITLPNGEVIEKPRNGDEHGGGQSAPDVMLQYADDDPDSYTNIWTGAKSDITTADQTRLIESLRKLSAGEELESVVDIEQVIRYFVVHNYVCNGDSYTGSIVHNYYLYEENGKLTMLPWDYNLAFGTFRGGDAQSTVNTPIDAPVSGGTGEDRPMWSWILSDETYTDLYHQYFAEFLTAVDIDALIDQAYALIQSYVERDPTAFYTAEEFETGVSVLRQFCALRSESIAKQLETGETTESMDYADASGINLADMGTMSGGGGFGGGMRDENGNIVGFGGRGAWNGAPAETAPSETDAAAPETPAPARPAGGFPPAAPAAAQTTSVSPDALLWLVGTAAVLGAGLTFALRYRKS